MAFKDYIILGPRKINSNVNNSKNDSIDFMKNNILNIFNNNNKECVLVVGQVQSGKTKNIEYCINYAIENKYDIVIFLAGITNMLLNQTVNRMINNIDNNLVYFMGKDSINSIKHNFDKNKLIVLQILKDKSTLEKTYDILFDIDLKNKKVLMIDDECDFGSINTGKENNTAIYKAISNIYTKILFGKLLLFTGTPFANLASSNSIDIYPDRIVSLENYNDYCGLHTFNKYSDDIYIELDITKTSSKDEITKYLFITTCIWILSTSVALLYDENYKSEFLINTYNDNKSQHEMMKFIKDIVLLIQKQIKSDQFLKRLQEINDNYTKFGINNWNAIIQKADEMLYLLVNNMEHNFVVLNSENPYSSEFKSSQKTSFSIIIGGYMISRGFTFESLTTEFFLNSPEDKVAIDTLLQRCRWFGNRKSRLKYMRIVTNFKIKNALLEAEKYVDLFEKGTSTTDITKIKNKIYELDKNNSYVESTNAAKRK